METYNHYAQVKPLKRSDGKSVVAAAAYRAGEKLVDKSIGVEFDFTPRGGVLASQIFAPANAPDWATIREDLWNQVELKEIRDDAQLARELQLQFPVGLKLETRREMLWDFCKVNFADEGMVADAVIHGPGEGDNRNDHAHVLLTMRDLTEEGFGNKNRDWNNKEHLEKWKQDWLERCNKTLADIDSHIRFERRSIADQRAEKLAAIERSIDWLEIRLLEIEAVRLDYTPRPHLPQKIYRAMVAGKAIPKGYEEDVKKWKVARDSKETATAEAIHLQALLDDELKISPPHYTEDPHASPIVEDQLTVQDDLADSLWREVVEKNRLRAGCLIQLADANPDKPLHVLLTHLPEYTAIVESERTGHFYFGLNFIEDIGKRAMNLGWRQFTSIACALREEIDWIGDPLELAPPTPEQLIERRRTLAKERETRQQDERAQKEKERQDRLGRHAADETDHRTKAIDWILCLYGRDPEEPQKWDSSWDPIKEWGIQLSLRALDPEQGELNTLLTNTYGLKTSDPVEFRKSVESFKQEQMANLIDAVVALDAIMDAETSRRWKARRRAIDEIVDQYSELRVHPNLQDSAIHLFNTKIKDICERAGLAAFYEHVLAPLIKKLTKMFALPAKEYDPKDEDQDQEKSKDSTSKINDSP